MMVIHLLENYPIMLTMLELSEMLQFYQTKIIEKHFKYFTAVPHYTVIAYLIIQDVHYYLQGKLINLGFVLVFFLLKNLCICLFHVIANSLKSEGFNLGKIRVLHT